MTRSEAAALARRVHTRARRHEPRHLLGAVPTAPCQTRRSQSRKAEVHELRSALQLAPGSGLPGASKHHTGGTAIQALFPVGQVVATPGALRLLEAAQVSPLTLLHRHVGGDWADLCEEDRAENQLSLEQGFRLLSSYRLPTDERVWIITEHDRSVTTLLLPDEY